MSTTPAIVLGAEINGLGVIRALGRAGVPVIALSSDPKQPTARSRFCISKRCANERTEEVVESLLTYGRTLKGRLPLFLTMEKSVAIVSRYREELQVFYLFKLPSADKLAKLNDKLEFSMLASTHGIHVPETIALGADIDITQATQGLQFPIVVKPRIKTGAFEAHFGARALFIQDLETLRERFNDYPWNEEPLLAQSFIASADSEIYFTLVYYDREGHCLASFSGRKLRIWPPRTGNTAYAEPANARTSTIEQTCTLFDNAGFTGLGSLEFKRSLDGQSFIAIEPTIGRTDYQNEIATANGVNIPYVAYRDLLGLKAQQAIPRKAPVKWRDVGNDQRSAQQAIAEGTLDRHAYRQSLKGELVQSLYANDDRRPWMYTQRQKLVKRTKRALYTTFDHIPWLYTPFQSVLPPQERWPAHEITASLRQHQLPRESFVRYFTRDPERKVPNKRGIIVSPTDGVIRDIFQRDNKVVIDISMNFYDIHMQRVPIDGTVVQVDECGHKPIYGSDDERGFFEDPWSFEKDYLFPVQKVTTLSTEIGEVVVRQISSIWARRIETFVNPGDKVTIGQRLGKIFLGSTVVIELPASVRVVVEPQIKDRRRRASDQPILGAETILAVYTT